jgi:hypothetical protein
MFVIKVEIWPYGDQAGAKEIGRIIGWNSGGVGEGVCRYNAMVQEDRDTMTDEQIAEAYKTWLEERVANGEPFSEFLNGTHVPLEHKRSDGMMSLIKKILDKYLEV